MSVISGKVLVSPFTNKMHLATILVISVAFGVLRLSGGGVKLTPARHDRLSMPESRVQAVPDNTRQAFPRTQEQPVDDDSDQDIDKPAPYRQPSQMMPTEANDAVLNDLMNSRKAATK